jgi:hypothetical protein
VAEESVRRGTARARLDEVGTQAEAEPPDQLA